MIKRVLAQTEGLEVGPLNPNEKWTYNVLQQTKDHLHLRNGVLFQKRNDKGNSIYQLVVPTSYQKRAMSGCLHDVGHVGWHHTLSLLREHFFWPGMAKMVTDYVAQCGRCLRRKAALEKGHLWVPLSQHNLQKWSA